MLYGTLTTIAVATLALCFLVVPVDSLTRLLDEFFSKVDFGPDRLEDGIAFIALAGLASLFCWQAGFDFYTRAFDFVWKYRWEGYLATGFTIAGGSSMLTKRFRVANLIPSAISGVSSYFGWGGTQNTTIPQDEESGSA